MKLNSITSRTKDFMPQLAVSDEENLEVIFKLKLVGIIFSSDLTWSEYIIYKISRVNRV